ncbi:hypothetical protein FXO38_24735 [Capsicum annuum]|nr:hypothetical protein FXO38_24735 [Capsicum annuum]
MCILPGPQKEVPTYSNSNYYERQKIERSTGVKGGNPRVEKGEVVLSEVRGLPPNHANFGCPSISMDICVGTNMANEGDQCQKKVAAQAYGGPSPHGKKESTQDLQGKIANSYILMHVNDNCMASNPLSVSSSLLIYDSNDSFPLIDDVHIVSVDILLDPIDAEIDSSCEINLCPPSVEAYMLNESTSSYVMGVDQLVCENCSPLEYNVLFENDLNTPNEPSGENNGIACLGSYILYANPLWCDNIPPKEGNLFLEDESTLKGKECVVAEATSSSTLCDFIVESTHGDYWETSSEYTHESTLVEVDLSDTFLYSLFVLDDMYVIAESISFSLGVDHGKGKCCRDLCLWTLFLFDPSAKFRNGDVGAPNFLLGLHDKQRLGKAILSIGLGKVNIDLCLETVDLKAWAFEVIPYLRQQVNYQEEVSSPRILRWLSAKTIKNAKFLDLFKPLRKQYSSIKKSKIPAPLSLSCTDVQCARATGEQHELKKVDVIVEATIEEHNITVDNLSTASKEEEKVEPVSLGE